MFAQVCLNILVHQLIWMNIGFVDMQKVEIFFERLELSKRTESSITDLSKLKFIKKRSDVSVVGTVEYMVDAGDDVEPEFEIFQLQGNEYRKTPFKFKRDSLCNFMKKDVLVYPKIIEQSTIPKGCPIPKGIYSIDYKPDFSNFPPALQGKFIISGGFYYKGKMVDTVKFYVEIQRYSLV